ncbi:glycine--tRNA ligase subunit beta [Candidatus Pelagibacter ubique]|jgi:glycyl-tRNA synthetase beta chain|nr:glycine--tRNA ligase subunit beta [Candidatus Pelagibacter ubique]MDC0633046.1 glycine--tRNA ligase subunit beta [Candidatus Pelagibacter ubique]MDC3294534.1 glycine--tRNA ligase subunit beta [Candidatus Pelagibacter ubique]MDC3401127.1 glycine--tRNA ligase subunit beta [Candidatus Pelagibacter ubique]
MSDFFIELFSEEIPAGLQSNSRNILLENFQNLFEEKKILFKKSSSFSTPNRLIILFEGLSKEIIQKAEEIKGPNVKAPEKAIEGFLRSNQIEKKDLLKKTLEKGEFYFFKKASSKINTIDLLQEYTPIILDKLQWKKSMTWGNYNLSWARPLKSILAVFDDKSLNFKFHHLIASNTTFIDKEFEDKKKIFKNFKSYKDFFSQSGIIIDHVLRKEFIVKEIEKISRKNNFMVEPNNKLLDEVTDIVEQPNILACKFDQKFLNIPKEILIITMQYHQKYFPTFDKKGKITNEFLVVANNKDEKGYIKMGNERVVEARLSDAQFFWEKNKSQNLVKQVSKLKNMNYFKGLGSYFDKIQRMRKLGGMISDELLISKDQVELSASICKVDLVSDIVGEFPELQGIMGGHFAEVQGFDKEIALAISEHYQPVGLDSKTPKKPFSIALALTDKIDTLVGFFGINQKPTSSKDPYALRRSALGVIKLLIDNNKEFKIKDLISYSTSLHKDQGFIFSNESSQKELSDFLMDRLKYYMKEKKIRPEVIEASIKAHGLDHMNKIYKKASTLSGLISKVIGEDIITSYKRAYSILESELKNTDLELSNTTDPGIFKNDYEKNLFKKINEIRKYFTNIGKDENYRETLEILAGAKKATSEFFDNVKVNDDDKNIKKNRLELLQMLCRTFDNYINFSNIDIKQ